MQENMKNACQEAEGIPKRRCPVPAQRYQDSARYIKGHSYFLTVKSLADFPFVPAASTPLHRRLPDGVCFFYPVEPQPLVVIYLKPASQDDLDNKYLYSTCMMQDNLDCWTRLIAPGMY